MLPPASNSASHASELLGMALLNQDIYLQGNDGSADLSHRRIATHLKQGDKVHIERVARQVKQAVEPHEVEALRAQGVELLPEANPTLFFYWKTRHEYLATSHEKGGSSIAVREEDFGLVSFL